MNVTLKNIIFKSSIALVAIGLSVFGQTAKAQYFGQNKVRYKNLKFQVYETPHFHLYYYTKNDSVIKNFAKESEAWYALHQQIFRDTFRKPNPIILYGNSPEFQQTTIIDGEIGVGTGGVTEGMKNRVFMPLQEINFQTRHVLGHELVHAFQYHTLIENDSTELQNIGNIPLWMVEGMAEYLSLGKVDANTAMWMRDAVLNKDIPSLRDLTENSKYFPYRYGQAFWAFIGSTYGDTTIMPFFKSTAKFGYEMAIRRTFGYDERTLSSLWKSALENTYKPMLKDSSQTTPIGNKLIDNVNGGEMNVAPAISPDGKYIAFLSEKDLFSIDLFLADAKTGKIIKKLTSRTKNGHIDEFNFIESAGAWSPDGKQFAFSAFSKGRNQLIIIDIANGKSVLEKAMGDVEQFGNLTWSPNGKDIAFTGLQHGQSDIFSYNLDTDQVTQLTNDKYTDFQPSYSSDGTKIVFSTDRLDLDKGLSSYISMNLAVLDIASKTVKNINIFPGANNFNPVYDSKDNHIYFLSNRDGFRNLYKYRIADESISQLTDYFTGISGITENSPALSISKNDEIVYSYYRSQRYTLYNANASDFNEQSKIVSSDHVDLTAATLPPFKYVGVDIVNKNLQNFLAYDDTPASSIQHIPYKPQFKLDYIASNGVGVSASRFGTGMSSGVQAIFSDILNTNQIFAAASVNGEIYDLGAQLAYINQESRWNWGGAISHIPYQTGTYGAKLSTLDGKNNTQYPVYEEYIDIIRIFEESAQAFTLYPFNKTTRVEFGTGISRYSYRVDRYSTYYDYTTINGAVYPTYAIRQDKRKISKEEYAATSRYSLNPFTVFQVNTALVGDNSYFGVAAPLGGYRYKIGIEQNFGSYTYTSPTIDLRKYIRAKPVTFAGRLYGYGRLGDVNQQLYPLYIGYPYLIRGFEAVSFYNGNNGENGFNINQLMGNRIAVANLEIRLPFTGPEKLAAVPSKFLFSDLNLFFDAGLAWDKGEKVKFGKLAPGVIGKDNDGVPIYEDVKVPVYSVGVSARVNIFGYFVLEPYLAWPFNRTEVKKPVVGLGFAPGW